MLQTVPHSKCSVSDKHVFAGAHITGAINNQPRQQAERTGSKTSEVTCPTWQLTSLSLLTSLVIPPNLMI